MFLYQVEQNSSAPLWPVIEKEDKLLLLRVDCSKDHAAPFLYTEQHSVCLKLNNEVHNIYILNQYINQYIFSFQLMLEIERDLRIADRE